MEIDEESHLQFHQLQIGEKLGLPQVFRRLSTITKCWNANASSGQFLNQDTRQVMIFIGRNLRRTLKSFSETPVLSSEQLEIFLIDYFA